VLAVAIWTAASPATRECRPDAPAGTHMCCWWVSLRAYGSDGGAPPVGWLGSGMVVVVKRGVQIARLDSLFRLRLTVTAYIGGCPSWRRRSG